MANQIQAIFAIACCLIFSMPLWAADELDTSLVEREISRALTDPDNSISITVEQPIELVFDALLTRLAEYSEDIVSIEFDHSWAENTGVLDIGSRRITTMVDGRTLVQRIVVFEPPERFAYFTDMSLSTVRVPIDYSIGYYTFNERDDGGVVARVSVAYKPSSRLTAFLVRIGFNRALVEDFKKAEAYLNSL